MFNILIIEDNLNELPNLINTISSNFSNIKVHSITHNIRTSIDIINNQKIDIIILDLKYFPCWNQ